MRLLRTYYLLFMMRPSYIGIESFVVASVICKARNDVYNIAREREKKEAEQVCRLVNGREASYFNCMRSRARQLLLGKLGHSFFFFYYYYSLLAAWNVIGLS